jgi:hypothetical protein
MISRSAVIICNEFPRAFAHWTRATPKPNARAATVLWDEYDPTHLERALDCLHCSALRQAVTGLELHDCLFRDASPLRKPIYRPVQQRASCSALMWREVHVPP